MSTAANHLRAIGFRLTSPDIREHGDSHRPQRCCPLLLIVILLIAVDALGIDQRMADFLYAIQGHQWALRNAFITETVIHRGGRLLTFLAWGIILTLWLGTLRNQRFRQWQKPLGYLLLSTLASAALIAWTKSWSNMDCPWDLVRYGGARPFVGLFETRPVTLVGGSCFPAAHAGTGYAWICLYFFLSVVRPQWRQLGLASAILAGLLFGIAQQLRGAHFISHDLWSLAVCWTVAAVLHALFWPQSGTAAVERLDAGATA